MKKIIAAVDFAEISEELIYFALDFVSQLNTDIMFVTVLDEWDVSSVGKISSMGYDVDGDHYSEEIEHDSIETFKKIVKKCGFPEIEKSLMIRCGRPAKEILKLIAEENTDAVIIGAKNRKDLEHTFELSIAEKIFKRSPATVISYRTTEHAKKLRKKIH